MAFDGSHAGGSNAGDTQCSLDSRHILLGDLESLGIKRIAMDRLESAEADVERHGRDVGPGFPALFENLGREVKAGGRGGGGSGCTGVHSLVAIAVLRPVRSLDVRRQGNMADPVQH